MFCSHCGLAAYGQAHLSLADCIHALGEAVTVLVELLPRVSDHAWNCTASNYDNRQPIDERCDCGLSDALRRFQT